METVLLKIEGMSCQHCVKSVETALKSLNGVSGVNVDLNKKSSLVEYDPSIVTLDGLKAAVFDQGFDVL